MIRSMSKKDGLDLNTRSKQLSARREPPAARSRSGFALFQVCRESFNFLLLLCGSYFLLGHN
jgi:hypothetical protein